MSRCPDTPEHTQGFPAVALWKSFSSIKKKEKESSAVISILSSDSDENTQRLIRAQRRPQTRAHVGAAGADWSFIKKLERSLRVHIVSRFSDLA